MRFLRPLVAATILAVIAVAGLLFASAELSGGACSPNASGDPPTGLAGIACDATWNMIQAINRANPPAFKAVPPGRQPNSASDPPTGNLSTVVTFEPKLPPVMEWRSRAAPTRPGASKPFPNSELQELQSQVDTLDTVAVNGNVQVSFPAYVGLVGYIVAREQLPDGTVRFAVAIPPTTARFTPADLDRAPFLVRQAEAGEQPGMAAGVIVWVHLWNARTYMERPLVTDSGWETKLSATIPAAEAPGPGPTFEYSRAGDLVLVGMRLQDASYDLQALSGNYRTHQNGNGLTYGAAGSAYETALASNRSTLERILADASRQVTLGQELADRRYEFVASSFYFVPSP